MVHGKGHFCWEGLENSSVTLSDFYCINTNFTLNTTGIWCNTKVTCNFPFSLSEQKWHQGADHSSLIVIAILLIIDMLTILYPPM